MNMQHTFSRFVPVAAPLALKGPEELFLDSLRDQLAAGNYDMINYPVMGVQAAAIADSAEANDRLHPYYQGWYRTSEGGLAYDGYGCGPMRIKITNIVDLGDGHYYQPMRGDFEQGVIYSVH